MPRSLVVVAAAILLGGCATSYAPLYSPTEVIQSAGPAGSDLTEYTKCKTPIETADGRLVQTLACAEILQLVYSRGYKTMSNVRDITSLPIIGGAGVAALILLNGKANAAKRAGRVGIGVGVLSAVRDEFAPATLPTTFIQGHAALGCVIAKGDYFQGDRANSISGNLRTALGELNDSIAALTLLRSALPAGTPTKQEADQLKASQAVADQALTLADDQLIASGSQYTAFEFANSVFRKAVTDIGAWVASRGRTRTEFSYDTFVGKYSAAPKGGEVKAVTTAETARAQMITRAEARQLTAAQLIGSLSQETRNIMLLTRELKSTTPDYILQLTEVRQCVTTLPSS